MPEGHVTHRLATALNRCFAGLTSRSWSPQGRFAGQAAALDGRRLRAADAYGKHIFAEFDDAFEVHVHLGLLGKWDFVPGPESAAPVVGQVRWRLSNPQHVADLRGATVCELVTADQREALLSRLGPDPLRGDADPEQSWPLVSRSRSPIGVLLMDQRVLAGVGNTFRAELLYRHRLDPMMAGRLLRRGEWTAMFDDLVELMQYAVVQWQIDTVRPEHSPQAMGRPARDDRHGGEVYVYRRAGQPCLVCGTAIRTALLASRNLFWCPKCQRRTRRRPPGS